MRQCGLITIVCSAPTFGDEDRLWTLAQQADDSHGVQAEDYTMWIVPESLAAAAGPAALERAVADGLNGRRSAELTPR